jgi:hypothetical protein
LGLKTYKNSEITCHNREKINIQNILKIPKNEYTHFLSPPKKEKT